MSNLSNLFISQSFYGMVNLENSLEPLASASGDVELQDGLGENLGLKINAQTKEFTIVNNFKVDGNADFNGDVDISGSLTHTGSIDIVGDLTIQGDVTANVGNFDTVNARLLNITEESASVIFSSGSNVLGDEETDRQDLIGQVIVSGTLGVEGNSAFTGSTELSGSTIISGSLTNKQSVSSEAFKIIAPGGQELVDVSINNTEAITLQSDVLLFSSGSQPSMKVRFNPGTGDEESTWRYQQITFPSGSYGNAAKIDVTGGKQYQFADSVNTEGIVGVNDNRTGIFFGTPYIFDGEFIIGKDKNNQRTIIGDVATVYMSSSIDVKNNIYVHGDIEADNDISSSTLNGIGNVTIYSASVDSRLDALESDTGSQDSRLDSLEAFTGSQETLNGFYNSFTASNGNDSLNTFTSSYYIDSASFDLRLDQQEAFSSSLVSDFVNTTDFNSYTQSQDNLNNTFATTGSNVFDGSQEITGSVKGNVENVSIASNTASFDCSLSNFFTVNLPTGSTHFNATNITPGQTISVKVNLDSDVTSVTTSDSILFPALNPYSPTQLSGSVDLISFVSFDASQLLGSSIKRLQ